MIVDGSSKINNMGDNSWNDFIATPTSLSSTSSNPGLDYTQSNVPGQFLILDPGAYNEVFGGTEIRDSISTPTYQQPIPTINPPQAVQPAFQTSFSEVENRALLVSNLNPETTQDELYTHFSKSSEIKDINMENISKGQATIEYYDLRHAKNMKELLNGTLLHGFVIMVVYAPLANIKNPKKPPNNGTIVVFHLPQNITNPHIASVFGQFGEIKQIRGTPTKPTQRFIEYWDTRASEAALNGLNTKYIMGSRISIEFSLPGGFRRSMFKIETPVQSKPVLDIKRAK